MNKKYGIMGLILVVILATVMISGCIGSDDNTNDKFPNAVTFQGVTFYLPEGYEYVREVTQGNTYFEGYTDGTNFIGLCYYQSMPLSEGLANIKSKSDYTNINENTSFGGYSGFSADTTTDRIFVFEKDGKTLSIAMNKELNFNEYVPKIIC